MIRAVHWHPKEPLLGISTRNDIWIVNIRWNKQGTYLATASDALRIWSKNGKLLYTAKPHGNSVLWGTDWISDSKKIVTVRFDSGNIQLWDGKANLLKTIN